LFHINVQDVGARPAIATHPGQPNIPLHFQTSWHL